MYFPRRLYHDLKQAMTIFAKSSYKLTENKNVFVLFYI